MKIKAVLFDIDGVLINSLKANRSFVNGLLKEQKKKGLSEEEFYSIRFMTIKQVIEKYCPELSKEKVEEIRVKWSEKYAEYIHLTEINQGVKEILEYLKGKVKLGVITNRGKVSVLEYHKIIDFFESIVTSADVQEPKPSPEGILKSMTELGVKPIETIFVGDAETDIMAGKDAGVKMLVFRVKIGKPEEIIQEFEEIKGFL